MYLLMVIGKKGQAATEFLISYGWVIFFLIISAVSLTLFFEFDSGMFVREECIIVPGLNCVDVSITEDSMSFVLVNDIGWDYSVMQISYEGCRVPSYSEPFSAGEYVNFTLSGCDFEGREVFEENDVFVTYTFGESTVTHIKSANVVSVVEGGNSQGYSGNGGSAGSPGGDWSDGGDGTYDPNADGATLLLCDFDAGFDCVGASPLVENNLTLVNGVNGQAVFVSEKINLLDNGDFEGTLPSYWNPYIMNNLSVEIDNKFSYRGSNSATMHRDGGLSYPGHCDEETCSYKSSCTWDSTTNTCSYSGKCTIDCGSHTCGGAPDVYSEGDELCWGNSNRVMYGGIKYGGGGGNELYNHINPIYDQNYSLSFMYRGSFPQALNMFTCYSSGHCSRGLNYPAISWNSISAGDYSSWQYYSDDVYVNSYFETACDGSCFRELMVGRISYGNTQPEGDTFYLDNVQLEYGDVASPFAGDGPDTLKYPADETTLDFEEGTIEMWVYVNDNIRETSQNRYLFAHSGSCGSGCYANRMSFGHMTNNKWGFAITNSTGATASMSVGDTLTEGWHHFAVTWDNSTEGGYIEMFIDGASVDKKTGVASNFPEDYESGLYVGSWNPSYGRVNTVIDELRISNIVRYT